MELLSALARGLSWMLAQSPAHPLPLDLWCVHGVCTVVEIARNDEQKRIGLMGRTFLPPSYGMLFVREDEEHRSFWMRNTLIPLQIDFYDADRQLIDSVVMQPCTADPCPSYRSNDPAMYVLETMAKY